MFGIGNKSISPVPEPPDTRSPWQKLQGLGTSIKSRVGNFFNPPPIRYQYVFPTPSPTPSPTPTPTPMPSDGVMTPYEKLTSETFDKYQIPRSVAYGIAQAENGKRNKFNIGAVDANPTNAPIWGELEAATKAAKLLSGEANEEFYGNRAAGKAAYRAAWEKRATPSAMLRAIEQAGYAGDPATWRERSASQGGAGLEYPSWGDFVMDLSGFRRWIK